MLASRLLWDKGVGDVVEAVRLLRRDGVVCRAVIVGKPDTENPHALPLGVLGQWEAEGLPKILLEATASARPIVATDVPGCRDVVRHGENGLLVPPHNPPALAAALVELLRDPLRRAAMGRRGGRGPNRTSPRSRCSPRPCRSTGTSSAADLGSA
jgi:glycosyltransferase involved in cell wall biosynthesis